MTASSDLSAGASAGIWAIVFFTAATSGAIFLCKAWDKHVDKRRAANYKPKASIMKPDASSQPAPAPAPAPVRNYKTTKPDPIPEKEPEPVEEEPYDESKE